MSSIASLESAMLTNTEKATSYIPRRRPTVTKSRPVDTASGSDSSPRSKARRHLKTWFAFTHGHGHRKEYPKGQMAVQEGRLLRCTIAHTRPRVAVEAQHASQHWSVTAIGSGAPSRAACAADRHGFSCPAAVRR
jgi:hypothetical protein